MKLMIDGNPSVPFGAATLPERYKGELHFGFDGR